MTKSNRDRREKRQEGARHFIDGRYSKYIRTGQTGVTILNAPKLSKEMANVGAPSLRGLLDYGGHYATQPLSRSYLQMGRKRINLRDIWG